MHFAEEEYGDESPDSGGYGSYDDEDVDENGLLDPDVVNVKMGGPGGAQPMPARTAKLEALMAEEEAARQALAQGERDKRRGQRGDGSGLTADILANLTGSEWADGEGHGKGRGGAGAASMTRLSLLSGATEGTTASARERERAYGEFLTNWGHVDFSLLFFLPVVKNMDQAKAHRRV